MATIHLDESGYTGDDLIVADQPVFMICTHSPLVQIPGVATGLRSIIFPRCLGHNRRIGNLVGRTHRGG